MSAKLWSAVPTLLFCSTSRLPMSAAVPSPPSRPRHSSLANANFSRPRSAGSVPDAQPGNAPGDTKCYSKAPSHIFWQHCWYVPPINDSIHSLAGGTQALFQVPAQEQPDQSQLAHADLMEKPAKELRARPILPVYAVADLSFVDQIKAERVIKRGTRLR